MLFYNTIDKTDVDRDAFNFSLDDIRQWPSESTEEWVKSFVEVLRYNPDVHAIIIFGSTVREVEYCSDIDLLYIYSGSKPKPKSPPIDVDIRAYQRTKINAFIVDGHEMLGWAVRFGRIIYQKDNYWSRLREKWKNRLPFPSEKEALARAQKAESFFNDIRSIGDDDAADEQLITMLTHLARAYLIRNHIYPASRPELPHQLTSIGENKISMQLTDALDRRKRRNAIYVEAVV